MSHKSRYNVIYYMREILIKHTVCGATAGGDFYGKEGFDRTLLLICGLPRASAANRINRQ